MILSNLIKKIHFEADSDGTSYPMTNGTDIGIINLNSAIEEVISDIQQVSDIPFDDINLGNISEGTITLTEGTSKYTITDRFRHILEIKVKDINGYYSIVDPVSQEEDESIVETDEALTGIPDKYRMVGQTIFLRPAPTATAVTLTAGLLFKYTRTSYQILTADVSTGTLVIGIDPTYHSLVAKKTALPYCKNYKKDRVSQLERDIEIQTAKLRTDYSSRLKNKHNIIRTKQRAFK